jgi:hypothetical protein
MNIHLPAILMFTRGTIGFATLPNIFFGFGFPFNFLQPNVGKKRQ